MRASLHHYFSSVLHAGPALRLRSVLHDHACVNPALRKLAQQYSNLVVYVDSIRNSYFARDLAWEETSA